MEPVTHFLTGACIGRAGLNRRTAYATLAATLARSSGSRHPLGIAGPVVSFQHHRGITIPSSPRLHGAIVTASSGLWTASSSLESSAIPASPLALGLDRRPHRPPKPSPPRLDQQLRPPPVLPFNAAGTPAASSSSPNRSLALLLSALVFPWLLGLADREIGARRTQFRAGAGHLRPHRHGRLLVLALDRTRQSTESGQPRKWQPPRKPRRGRTLPHQPLALARHPRNPTTWQTAEVDTRTGAVQSDPAPTPSSNRKTLQPSKQPNAPSSAASTSTVPVPVVRDLGPTTIPGQPRPASQPIANVHRRIQRSPLRLQLPRHRHGLQPATRPHPHQLAPLRLDLHPQRSGRSRPVPRRKRKR